VFVAAGTLSNQSYKDEFLFCPSFNLPKLFGTSALTVLHW